MPTGLRQDEAQQPCAQWQRGAKAIWNGHYGVVEGRVLPFPNRLRSRPVLNWLAHRAPQPCDRPAAIDRREPLEEIEVRQPPFLSNGGVVA